LETRPWIFRGTAVAPRSSSKQAKH
jgi:hypothetical protein